jgi:hypothetical protein
MARAWSENSTSPVSSSPNLQAQLRLAMSKPHSSKLSKPEDASVHDTRALSNISNRIQHDTITACHICTEQRETS